ncbi:DUF3833 domain-containing protein [Ferrimonas aestuarii]|uniref:DUF3833 domain-containing protein n=1 Tax=Ferrimonas aestuarii TaxID=2569539 RepID=A0A4U1BQY0_9GAMM|nr:DUF3833 domain-containing protein [Ferrimonas aestuarii]TKB56558.1 DUF3833 domain-containing protein [Ferrimonas aestuarii]
MRWFVMLLALTLSGCSQDLREYQSWKPDFALEQFFDGKVKAYGVVFDLKGQISRRFIVDIDGSWQQNQGVLDEYFTYADGEKQFRRWVITKNGDGTYEGRADDIIGTAVGQTSGPVLHWEYEMNLITEDNQWQVTFDDTMVLIDDNHLLNRAKIKKFGITVAEVFIAFERVSD